MRNGIRYKAALGSLYRYFSNEFDIGYNPVKGILHGEFKLGVYNNILYAKLYGSWNEETAFVFLKN